jgi:hypothetical protein
LLVGRSLQKLTIDNRNAPAASNQTQRGKRPPTVRLQVLMTGAPLVANGVVIVSGGATFDRTRLLVRPTMIASSIRFSTARLKCRRGGACSILSRSNRSGHLFGRPWIAEEPGCRRHGEVIDLVYFHGKSVKEVAESATSTTSRRASSSGLMAQSMEDTSYRLVKSEVRL